MTTQNRRNPGSTLPTLPTLKSALLSLVSLALLPILPILGCSGPPVLPAGSTFTLAELTWNGKMASFGQIAAVAEIYDDTLVLTDTGAVVLTSGVQLASDTSVKSWSRAAVLPAADLSGEWAVAIDGNGALRRLKNRSVMEDISDRYGLAGTPVTELAAMGTGGAAFALAGGIAIADGQTVTRMDGALSMLAGGEGRVAGVIDGKLRLVDAKAQTAKDFDLLVPPTGVVFDPAGKLLVATPDTLYQEGEAGVLQKIHTSPGEPIRGMTRSGSVLWLHLGDSLAMVQDGALRRAADGDASAALPADAKLFGSPSGDIWTLSGGTLRLLAEDSGGGADQDLWRRNAQPVFTRLCATCHLPGGSSGIDLSTYATWAARRAAITRRVIEGKPTPMPPAGAGMLTADERAALQLWTDNAPAQM